MKVHDNIFFLKKQKLLFSNFYLQLDLSKSVVGRARTVHLKILFIFINSNSKFKYLNITWKGFQGIQAFQEMNQMTEMWNYNEFWKSSNGPFSLLRQRIWTSPVVNERSRAKVFVFWKIYYYHELSSPFWAKISDPKVRIRNLLLPNTIWFWNTRHNAPPQAFHVISSMLLHEETLYHFSCDLKVPISMI